MKGKKNKAKSRRWMAPVILGFLILYLMTAGLSTYFMGLRYREEFRRDRLETQHYFVQTFSSLSQIIDNDADEEVKNGILRYLLSSNLLSSAYTGSPYQQFSCSLYDAEGKAIARSQSCLTSQNYFYEGRYYPYAWALTDYLTETEQSELAHYAVLDDREEIRQLESETPPDSIQEYRATVYLKTDGWILCRIVIQKIVFRMDGEAVPDPLIGQTFSWSTDQYPGIVYYQTEGDIVWEWENADLSEEQATMQSSLDLSGTLPYIEQGYHRWEMWEQNAYLHDFPQELEEGKPDLDKYGAYRLEEAFEQTDASQDRTRKLVPVISTDGGEDYWMILASESHPWLAAADYMKYVYLAGLVLMLACMGMVLGAMSRTRRERTALDEARKDFIHAAAHELKTPPGIIRGFAENLLEHNMEEKRDYYLTQIIGQTEEIDRLVSELLAMSRIDSGHLVLQKEPNLSMSELIREQLERTAPLIGEKRLQVQLDCEEDFRIDGDRAYLSKAIWNLLSNAAVYNLPDGEIRIRIQTGRCTIENTGIPLKEEQLAHVFDLFYSGDKSYTSGDRNMGLGLFLSRKILSLHHLELMMENTEDGVRVVILG